MERRRDSDRRVADRRQDSGKDIAASVLEPESSQTKTVPTETTIVFGVENAPRLLKRAVNESNRFFAKDITALEVPDEFYKTYERLREIGLTRFEPLVLPQWTLLENDPLWEGKVKPEPRFWENQQNGNLKPESAILQQGVYLIDGRARPDFQDGKQKYEDDGFMEEMLKGLRRKGVIERDSYILEDSRFGVSPWEIEEVILPELARAIGKEALGSEGRVVNNSYIIFNIVGNMRHPEWGKTNTWEWFADKFWFDNYLRGGHSDNGGLAHVYCSDRSDDRYGHVGFRPLLTFPSKT
jgi:hypothetical protein